MILIIDDEPLLLEIIKMYLHEYEVKTVNNLEDFWANLNEDTKLVISDNYMPEIEGSQLLKLVKVKYPHIKTLLISGSPINNALKKPFNQEEIIHKVKELI